MMDTIPAFEPGQPPRGAVKPVVAYDFLQVHGGAEAVSKLLARRLEAELLVHSHAETLAPSRDVIPEFHALTSKLTSHAAVPRALAAWYSFERLAPREDVASVLFSGHYAPLSWAAFPGARKVLYLHAFPLPWLAGAWNASGARHDIVRRLAVPALALYQARYLRAAQNMDAVLANSAFTARCFRRLTGLPAKVIHPPVAGEFLGLHGAYADDGYWMSWARHEPGKRIDRIVRAFVHMPDERLVIAGDGSQSSRLKALAHGAVNIRFTGTLDRSALLQCIRGAAGALHVAAHEPFGLAVAEALAAGRYVIAANGGGVNDLVRPDSFARLISPDPSVEEIIEAVREGRARLARHEVIRPQPPVLAPAQFASVIGQALQVPGYKSTGSS